MGHYTEISDCTLSVGMQKTLPKNIFGPFGQKLGKIIGFHGGGEFLTKNPPPPTKSNRDLDLKILKRVWNIFVWCFGTRAKSKILKQYSSICDILSIKHIDFCFLEGKKEKKESEKVVATALGILVSTKKLQGDKSCAKAT